MCVDAVQHKRCTVGFAITPCMGVGIVRNLRNSVEELRKIAWSFYDKINIIRRAFYYGKTKVLEKFLLRVRSYKIAPHP